jgi:hypothetical protein
MLSHLPILIIFLLGGTVGSLPAQALDSFGGSCASQGQWTNAALFQTQEIKKVIDTLKSDPNCKGIETRLPALENLSNLMLPKGETGEKSSRMQNLGAQTDVLHDYVATHGQSGEPLVSKATGALAQAAIEAAALPLDGPFGAMSAEALTELKQRLPNAANYGISLLDQVMEVATSLPQCMNNRPNKHAPNFVCRRSLSTTGKNSPRSAKARSSKVRSNPTTLRSI